jgi:hypothetical protein
MPRLTPSTELVDAIKEFISSVDPAELDLKIRSGTLYIEVDLPSDVAEDLVDLSDEEDSLGKEVDTDEDD